jgi:hypothetical protein
MTSNRKRKLPTKEEPVLQQSLKKQRTKKTISSKSEQNKSLVEVPTTTTQKSLSSLIHEPSWSKNLQDLFNTDNFKRIEQYLNDQWSNGKITYPPNDLIFEAFNKTPFDKVKVVLLGQDPYHDDGQVETKILLKKKIFFNEFSRLMD